MDGNRLRDLRRQRGMSQEELARRAGYGVRTIRRIERGMAQPQPATAKNLADALGVQMADLQPPTARHNVEPPKREMATVMVLPLAHDLSQPHTAHIAADIAADLARRMPRYWGLPLAAPPSLCHGVLPSDVQAAHLSLAADYAIGGAVQQRGDWIRARIWLLFVPEGRYIWSQRYDFQGTDALSVADDVTDRILGAIQMALHNARGRQAEADLDANEWDRVSLALTSAFRTTREDNHRAQDILRQILTVNPQSFTAHAILSVVLIQDFWSADPGASLRAADAGVAEALRIQPDFASALICSAAIQGYSGNHRTGQDQIQRVLEMDSGISHAHWTLGELLVGAGHPIEGLESLMRAHRHSPEDPLAHLLCLAIAVGHFTCGDYAEAEAWCQRSLGRDKKYQPSHLWLAASQERQGRLKEARRTLSESPEGDVDWLWILSQIRGHAFQSFGEAFAAAVRRASTP